MKEVLIRKAQINDKSGIGHVHYHSWNETYEGLIDQSYLDSRSVEECIRQAETFYQNAVVATVDERIVGFACCMKSRDVDLENTGEITAVYVLEAYQGLGIGKKLMNACFDQLNEYAKMLVWVLKENHQAITFYERQGFRKDGECKTVRLNESVKIDEVRMIK